MDTEQQDLISFDSLKGLLLEMAHERSLDELLWMIVRRLAERPHIALARIWLIQPGDVCSSCRMRPDCPEQRECLHLVASAGTSIASGSANWSDLDGAFRRFPLGVRKVGMIAAKGEGIALTSIDTPVEWVARKDWAQNENIHGFNGQPVVYKGKVLGVLAVFTRVAPPSDASFWIRMLADHAAAAIVNARAFEEIGKLRAQLESENTYLKEEVQKVHAFGDIVGESPALQNALEKVTLVASTDASVLLLGESGTGKELMARAIHESSLRCERSLVKVNCASIPRELFESEFFGHVKGSFTGAVKDRIGRFQLADGGTLFLDEVGEIPLESQGKLLRVLQEGQYERVGDEKTKTVNVRIIAATNRDLKKEVEAGRFRQDLYYRLSVFPIEIPPLRERREDIPLLASQYLVRVSKELEYQTPTLTDEQVQRLQEYDWPGNIRELQNVLERAVIISKNGQLQLELLLETPKSRGPERLGSRRFQDVHELSSEMKGAVISANEWKQHERENILVRLQKTEGKVYGPHGTARLLGIKPTTLASRIKSLNIDKPNPLATSALN